MNIYRVNAKYESDTGKLQSTVLVERGETAEIARTEARARLGRMYPNRYSEITSVRQIPAEPAF